MGIFIVMKLTVLPLLSIFFSYEVPLSVRRPFLLCGFEILCFVSLVAGYFAFAVSYLPTIFPSILLGQEEPGQSLLFCCR